VPGQAQAQADLLGEHYHQLDENRSVKLGLDGRHWGLQLQEGVDFFQPLSLFRR